MKRNQRAFGGFRGSGGVGGVPAEGVGGGPAGGGGGGPVGGVGGGAPGAVGGGGIAGGPVGGGGDSGGFFRLRRGNLGRGSRGSLLRGRGSSTTDPYTDADSAARRLRCERGT